MSMESHVMFRGALPEWAALNAVLRELDFPVALTERDSLEGHRGFMPVTLWQRESGVEFDVFDDAELLAQFAGEIDPAFDRTASFRWGGDEEEMVVGVCTAAALAKLTGGVVFDEAEEPLLDVDGAIAVARTNLAAVAQTRADGEGAETGPS